MWVKYLWISLVTGAVVAAAVHDAPRELSSADWPLHRFYFPSQHPLIQQDDFEDSWRWKRTGPSLSVSNPIEVLRSRLLLEIARRRMQKDNQQVNNNRQLLTSVGKRQTSPFRTSFRVSLNLSELNTAVPCRGVGRQERLTPPKRTTDQNPKSPDYFSNNSGDVEWDTS